MFTQPISNSLTQTVILLKVNRIIRIDTEKGKSEADLMQVAFPCTSDVLQMCICEAKAESQGESVSVY